MIFVTSICPAHTYRSIQLDCAKEWRKMGKVYSLNTSEEIELLIEEYGGVVEFIEVAQSAKLSFGKPYIFISDILDFIRGQKEPCWIINSDISIHQDRLKAASKLCVKGAVYLHRWDYKEDKMASNIYLFGVDAILIRPELIKYIPRTLFFLGGTYWDIIYPYLFLSAGIPIISVRNTPVIYHKLHDARYSDADWKRLGKLAAWTINQDMSPAQTSSFLYNAIKSQTRWENL